MEIVNNVNVLHVVQICNKECSTNIKQGNRYKYGSTNTELSYVDFSSITNLLSYSYFIFIFLK